MNEIYYAIIAVSVIGVICAVLLAVASKVMAVKEDERFPAIRACLPGANCGACGYAGCDGYAKALVEMRTLKQTSAFRERTLFPDSSASCLASALRTLLSR